MPDGRVVLYDDTSEGGSWVVDAAINMNGGVSICSGDGAAEWYAIIDRPAMRALIEALRKHLDTADGGSATIEDEVPCLLVLAFGGGSPSGNGPYSDIARFLDNNGIPWRSEFWGTM